MKSIRQRLILTLLPAFVAITVAGGSILYIAVRTLLVSQFDAALDTKVRSLASQTTWTSKGIDFDFADEFMPEFEAGPNAEYFEIRLADGTVLERSRSLKMDDSIQPSPTKETAASAIWNGALPDGRPGRMAALHFQPQPDRESSGETAGETVPAADAPQATVIVARSRAEIDRPLEALMAGLLGAGAVMAAALAIVVLRAVSAGLQPLRRMGAAVESIDAASLSSRIDSTNVPSELRPVCIKLNELLDRLEDAFARERRFSSAAAHELRTPVAELRTMTEVSLKWPADPAAQEHVIRQALDIALQMERMIETLLRMARAQPGELAVRHENLAIQPLLRGIVHSHEAAINRKSIALRNDVPASLVVQTDRTILTSILANLLDNAVEYTPEHDDIHIEAARNGRATDIVITNTNNALESRDMEYLSEPYWRKDAAHTDPTHCGLGLTLVQQLATAAGMMLQLSLGQSGEFVARISIPEDEPSIG